MEENEGVLTATGDGMPAALVLVVGLTAERPLTMAVMRIRFCGRFNNGTLGSCVFIYIYMKKNQKESSQKIYVRCVLTGA